MDKIQGVEKSVPSLPSEYEVPEVWEPPQSTGGTFGSINQPTAGARTEEDLPRGKHDLQLYSLGTPNGVKVLLSDRLSYNLFKNFILACNIAA